MLGLLLTAEGLSEIQTAIEVTVLFRIVHANFVEHFF
jgi:hypothetical protein